MTLCRQNIRQLSRHSPLVVPRNEVLLFEIFCEGDSLLSPVHREQQDGEADGDLLLHPPTRPHLRRALQDGHDRVLQTRHGRQVAREVHRAHAGEAKTLSSTGAEKCAKPFIPISL